MSDTPITDKIIADADSCPETRVVFLIKHLANQCKAFERASRSSTVAPVCWYRDTGGCPSWTMIRPDPEGGWIPLYARSAIAAPGCPYCTSDNSAIRGTFYDQNCAACVKRMGVPADGTTNTTKEK